MNIMTFGSVAGDPNATNLRQRETIHRFDFGSVSMEILVDNRLDFQWNLGTIREYYVPPTPGLCASQLRCSVWADPHLEAGDPMRRIAWGWQGEQAPVEAYRARTVVRRLSPGLYAATARILPDPGGCTSLVSALASVVVDREGGLVLHASAVEVDGRVVLFIGPSGAGKTTACNHMTRVRCFARDRVALVRAGTTWQAWPLPGGDKMSAPPCERIALPVAGILRVQRRPTNEATPFIRTASAKRAALLLRESIQAGDSCPARESSRFSTILHVQSQVPVGELFSDGKSSLDDCVRSWLSASRSPKVVSS